MSEAHSLGMPVDEAVAGRNGNTEPSEMYKVDAESACRGVSNHHREEEGYCYVPKNAKKLMEVYTARPSRGRPMTWRHYLEPPEQKFATQDYTKTPIPKKSRRLMARQCEGLLMRRLERIMRSPYGSEYSTALKILTIKTWDPTFNITLYPPVMEGLLTCYARIREHLGQQIRHGDNGDATLFNEDEGDDLSYLVRIAAIFRNLSHATYNRNILATHPGIVSVICDLISLECAADPRACEETAGDASGRHLDDNDDDYLTRQLQEIQFSLLEVLSCIAHTLMLGSAADAAQSSGVIAIGDANSSIMNKLSDFGKHIARCLPRLVDLALSSTESTRTCFLAIETLAKLALNSNSRPLWLSVDHEKVVNLMLKLLQYALRDDQLSEWAIFAAYHISLNGMNLPMAQALCKKDVVEYLVLLCDAQQWSSPEKSSPESAYRRYSMAFKSVSILQKLVSLVPIRHRLAKHESTLVSIFSSSSEEIAKPLKHILVQY